ncbi:MAG: NUDIX hydrolase [Pseudomonadota bacterium]
MRPKDASSIVLVDRRGPEPRLLMGRRAAKHAFMPNIYVFPGGRVDYGDRFAPVAIDYHADTLDLLMQQMKGRPTPLRARMLGLAAIRETHEEVGLILGVKTDVLRQYAQPTWAAFASAGIQPDLSRLTFIARAITPPGRNRRFDTRFFLADVSDILEQQEAHSSEELEDVRWVTLSEAADLETHPITDRVLDATGKALDHSQTDTSLGASPLAVPYYQPKRGGVRLEKLITYLRPGAEPIAGGEIEIGA